MGVDRCVKNWEENQGVSPSLTSLTHAEPQPSLGFLRKVWAVGGGKGGVGKSLVASSLAISLARLGHRVVAVDLDLGGANLHTSLGLPLPEKSLGDYMANPSCRIESCVTATVIPNLSVVSGAQDHLGIANIRPSQKSLFLKHLKELAADYLIFDLGAGTHAYTLDFFLFSQVPIVTLLPEPTSIENAYRFIKGAYYRHLLQAPTLIDIRSVLELAHQPKNTLGIRSPQDLAQWVEREVPHLFPLFLAEVNQLKPKLIMNQTRMQSDVDIGHSIVRVCRKYFGIQMDYLGAIDYDSAAWQAIRKKRPVMLEFPNSRIAAMIDRVTQALLKQDISV